MHPDLPAFALSLLQIVWIDLLLSGDNAIVIALACRSLPDRQRQWAVWLGAGAAVGLRVLFTLSVVQLMALPYVKLVGGFLLLLIAVRLIGDEEEEKDFEAGHSIWTSIRIIVVADAVMSLDNVVAVAAAARGSALLIFIGLALSIPLIVAGSNVVLSLLGRFPALVWAGSAMLGWIGGDFIVSEPMIAGWLSVHASVLEPWLWGPAGAAFVLAIAWLRSRPTLAQDEA